MCGKQKPNYEPTVLLLFCGLLYDAVNILTI
jgi:hypothetical protein